MRRPTPLLLGLVLAGACCLSTARAQFVDQRYLLAEGERLELSVGRDRLQRRLVALKTQAEQTGTPKPEQIPDAEIYLDGVDRCLRQNLFFAAQNVAQARACLREGDARVTALMRGETPWTQKTGPVVLGYRSEVDGSAQPYQVFVPAEYKASPPERLDLFLHGRAGTLNEVSFLTSFNWVRAYFGTETVPFLALYPYGRSNNGWRFAGERDMFEALASTKKRFAVDPSRVLVRGFSMGGHGTWHIGFQHPGEWAAMSPGAGFVDTKNYQKITEPLPDWQEALLHMYDPVDYAANAANLPVFAYTGDIDPAIEQHRLMMASLRREQVPFHEYIGPNTPHRYEPATLQAILLELAKQRRPASPEKIDFVTYTLRFPECRWVRLEGLERHWQRAEVHAQRSASGEIRITTRNVSALRLNLAPSMLAGDAVVDGKRLPLSDSSSGKVYLVKGASGWRFGISEGLRKKPGLQGPIDDALFGPVVAVRGTGKPWSEPLNRWLDQETRRFRDGWDEYFRATLPERTDQTLTAEDIRDKNLYLFGDPGSNAVIRRLLPKLPLTWTKDGFLLAGKQFSHADHVPMLIFPNPENPERYVVLNTGFTFSQADWRGSNARQYAHLPDYAAVRFNPAQFSDDRRANAALAGFFDERWRLPE